MEILVPFIIFLYLLLFFFRLLLCHLGFFFYLLLLFCVYVSNFCFLDGFGDIYAFKKKMCIFKHTFALCSHIWSTNLFLLLLLQVVCCLLFFFIFFNFCRSIIYKMQDHLHNVMYEPENKKCDMIAVVVVVVIVVAGC